MARRKIGDDKVEEVLANWNTVAEFLKTAAEDEVQLLLDHELANGRRPYIVDRLYTRVNRLRMEKGRKEILSKLETKK